MKPRPLGLDQRYRSPLSGQIDWPTWLRLIERKRRRLRRTTLPRPRLYPREYFALATASSFQMDGMDVTDEAVVVAMNNRGVKRVFRSRQSQRLRNHVAILRHIESSLDIGEPLRTSAVMRWYTSVSCGLSTTGLDEASMMRLEQAVRRINSPQLRLQPAVDEIARLHVQFLRDPLVPSFNGILSRLLLRYHLGRCALPPVLFEPTGDAARVQDDATLLPRLLELIDQSYDLLLAMNP